MDRLAIIWAATVAVCAALILSYSHGLFGTIDKTLGVAIALSMPPYLLARALVWAIRGRDTKEHQ